MNDNTQTAIELVLFKPKPNLSMEEVKNALASLNTVISSYKGFISRQIAYNEEEKTWMDLVIWQSMDDARFASEDVMKNETALNAFSVIDEKEMQFMHFTSVS